MKSLPGALPVVIDVSILVLPETGPMVPYGLYEVLHAAGRAGADPDTPARFRPRIVARDSSPLVTSIGVTLAPELAISSVDSTDIVVVCDAELAPDEIPVGRWSEETGWLRRQRAAGSTICSTCSGALVLAEAGLLQGKEATSHWATAALFRDHYPSVRFQPHRILCESDDDGTLITTGGASSWQDLALYLIGRTCGAVEAARVARQFVIGDRSEGQLPFAAMTSPRRHEDSAIAEVQAWLAENYTHPNPVASMSARSGLQDRTFKRRFRRATGYAPLDYVHALRVEEAKHLLETTDSSIEVIAAESGYADPGHFSRLFKRLAGVSPPQWRRRYRMAPLMRKVRR